MWAKRAASNAARMDSAPRLGLLGNEKAGVLVRGPVPSNFREGWNSPTFAPQKRGRDPYVSPGPESGLHPTRRNTASVYDKPRRNSPKAATPEPTSTEATTTSDHASEGPPELGSGLTVAVALALAVALAVGETVAVLRTVVRSEVKT